MTRRLLVLGEYDVGKSHFAAQLLGRLNQEQGVLRMEGAPETLEPYETALARINSGKAAPHTSQDAYVESCWPLVDRTGRKIDLQWPDYGGEQLRAIRDRRSMPADWRNRIIASGGWIVMLRISHQQLSDDIFTRPLAVPGSDRQPPESFEVSQQAQLVDFLQWLMFVRGSGTLTRVATPPLMLLLSCWDELPQAEQGLAPVNVLKGRMPMIAGFAEANWEPSALHVLGLSSLERPLSEDAIDSEFVDRGPEAFGYVVLPDGRRDPDLTLAIAAMI
tara:strand:- start:29703 stop:30530 length:828 start_codon:yes stop_codon:yes gene_type:complete